MQTDKPRNRDPKKDPKKRAKEKEAAPKNPLLEEARRLRLKRRFSQNFLVDENVLTKIAACMSLNPGEGVVEIGAGAGFLTQELLKTGASVHAIEVERYMAEYLRRKFVETPNLKLHEADILRFDFTDIDIPKFKIAGNLPYSITSPIIFRLIGELADETHPFRDRIEQITIMVQKEVGERLSAIPGQKAYNALSIAAQYRYDIRPEFVVPAKSFLPAPKVESMVISLIPRKEPVVKLNDIPTFAKLIQAAFSQRRKTVRNALLQKSFAPVATLDAIFEKTGINPQLRPEALSIENFGAFANAYTELTRKN